MGNIDRPRPSETRLDADRHGDLERTERDTRAQIDRWLDGEDEYVGFEAYVRDHGRGLAR